MLNLLWNIFFFIMTLSILITIHELGHFLIAKLYKIEISRFSIGFGRVLWSKKDKHGTEYVISMIPLGGYVKMLEKDDNSSKLTLKKKFFSEQNAFVKSFIISFGSISNFLLAIFLYCIVYIHGINTIYPIISNVIKNSIADNLNITPGMVIKTVNGVTTSDWNAVHSSFLKSINSKVLHLCVSHENSNNCINKRIYLNKFNFDFYNNDPFLYLGIIEPNYNFSNIISYIEIGSPAELFKLHIGDVLYKINNIKIKNLVDFINQIITIKNSFFTLTIIRNNIKYIFKLPLQLIKKNKFKNFLGIYTKKLFIPKKYQLVKKYNLFISIKKSILNTFYIMYLTMNLLLKTIFGQFNISNLSGPISIAKSSGISARYGIFNYFTFLALISINIGIINLFPMPILDGGYLLFILIEKIKGKKLSEKFYFYSYRISSILLFFLMIIALFNDLSHF